MVAIALQSEEPGPCQRRGAGNERDLPASGFATTGRTRPRRADGSGPPCAGRLATTGRWLRVLRPEHLESGPRLTQISAAPRRARRVSAANCARVTGGCDSDRRSAPTRIDAHAAV